MVLYVNGKKNMINYYSDMAMPWGHIQYYHDTNTIRKITLSPKKKQHAPPTTHARRQRHHTLEERLKEYRDTGTADFSDTPLDLGEATTFQKSVWRATQSIPAGETRSYHDIANAIGSPNATRAVGTALGANPLPILIPCHRVTAKDGGIGGFSSGTALKKKLLAHEKRP